MDNTQHSLLNLKRPSLLQNALQKRHYKHQKNQSPNNPKLKPTTPILYFSNYSSPTNINHQPNPPIHPKPPNPYNLHLQNCSLSKLQVKPIPIKSHQNIHKISLLDWENRDKAVLLARNCSNKMSALSLNRFERIGLFSKGILLKKKRKRKN